MTSSPYIQIRITRIVTETPGCKTFYLENTDGSPLHYKAGQFITFVFPRLNGTESRRSYSFSTTPGIDPVPAITLKRVENGEFSRWFIDIAKPGDTLLSIGTSGYFTLPDNPAPYQQVFLLAAGSGITPVYSILKYVLKHFPALPVVLVYSNRQASDTIFYEGLQQLAQQHPQFTLEYLFSTSQNLSRARLGKVLMEKLLEEYSLTPYSRTLYYICGPFDYMRMATIVMQTEGVPADNIRRENFSLVKPKIKEEPADKEPHAVEIRLNGTMHRFTTQYPDTILQQAKKLNINIPYSCESGQCGTCAASCVEGRVWMWHNEVLVDSEIAKGRILTCTGYPVGGDVVIEVP